MKREDTYTELPAQSKGAASSVFIDCNEQSFAQKTKWPERPHCNHGKWISKGPSWRSPTYKTWENILRRTRYWDTTNRPAYDASYEGVKVEWDSYEEFRSAVGPRPSIDHTIDRIDPEGDYTTDNCRWLLASINYSKGARTRAKQQSAAMIERMEAELEDLENELKKEGIEIE